MHKIAAVGGPVGNNIRQNSGPSASLRQSWPRPRPPTLNDGQSHRDSVVRLYSAEDGVAVLGGVRSGVTFGSAFSPISSSAPVSSTEPTAGAAAGAAGITDGAASILVLSEKAVEAHGVTPQARLVAYTQAGVEIPGIAVGLGVVSR